MALLTLQQEYDQTQNATTIQVAKMAMITVALTVAGETLDPLHVSKYNKRHDLATRVLNDPDYYAPRFLATALALNAVAGYPTDQNKIDAITSVFDKIAGVAVND